MCFSALSKCCTFANANKLHRRVKAAAQHSSSELGSASALHFTCHVFLNVKYLMFNGTLYFDTDAGEEPATLLGDEVCVHATAVVTGSEKIVDIQAKGDRSQRIFATEVDDGMG